MLLGINPFDQFGVELGKEIARKLGRVADDARARSVDARADRKGRAVMADFDLFVIGAGSGGVRAARVAAAHGAGSRSPRSIRSAAPASSAAACPRSCSSTARISPRISNDAAMFGWDVPQKRFDWPVLRDNVLAEVGRLEGPTPRR